MNIDDDFIDVIKDNEGLIFKITTIYTNSGEEQKDLYQEIVYQLWKSFGSFRQESKISTWIYRVALNTAIYFLKKEKRRGVNVGIEKVILKLTEQHDTLIEDRLKILYEQIHKLNNLEKGIVLLYLEGNSYEEIAIITGLSATNIGTRLSRIKQKLKAQINE